MSAQEKKNIYMTGIVEGDKAEKTISISVERIFQHSVYKKIVRVKKKYLAHDEKNSAKAGDLVKVKLVRPISKKKRWLLVDILTKAPVN